MVEKERSERSISPIEGVYLARWIEHFKPRLFIESGSDIGFSGECICEALAEYVQDPTFYTVEIDPDRARHARERLARFSFATVVTGRSDAWLKTWPKRVNAPTAFFLDGPKGRGMLPVFRQIMRRFVNIQFIAVHDCYCGGTQRQVVRDYFAHEYMTVFTDLHSRQMGFVFPSMGTMLQGRELAGRRLARRARFDLWLWLLPLVKRVLR